MTEFDSITKITIPKDFDSRGAAAIIAVFVQRVAEERSWSLQTFMCDILEATTKAGLPNTTDTEEMAMRFGDPYWDLSTPNPPAPD